MTAAPTSREAPTLQALLERIDATRPVLERNAAQTEADRRVPQENIDALTAAGAFKVTVPRRYGGYEMTLREKLEVSAAVAESCGSTGWVVALINVCNWAAGLLPEKAQQEIFGASPDAKVAGVLNPTPDVRKVEGGYEISGKWPWASGSLHADWALLGTLIVDEAGEPVDQALAFVPMGELTIEDTWFVAGMKGTGSNTIVGEKVFVPEHRLLPVPRAIDNEYRTGTRTRRSTAPPSSRCSSSSWRARSSAWGARRSTTCSKRRRDVPSRTRSSTSRSTRPPSSSRSPAPRR